MKKGALSVVFGAAAVAFVAAPLLANAGGTIAGKVTYAGKSEQKEFSFAKFPNPKFCPKNPVMNVRGRKTVATTATTDEMPAGTPSVRARRRDASNASWFSTVITSSMRLLSKLSGINPAPIPWIGCGAGLPPEITGLAAGSTAIISSSLSAPVPSR